MRNSRRTHTTFKFCGCRYSHSVHNQSSGVVELQQSEMCFEKFMDFVRSSYRKLCNEREDMEGVTEQHQRLVELQPVRPEVVLLKDFFNSLVGQAVLQCKVMRVRDDITEAPSLHLMTEIPDEMRGKIVAMKTQRSNSGEDLESFTTAIASTSMAPDEAPLRCGMAVYPWGETSFDLTVDGEPKDIEWFEEQYLDPTQSEGKIGNLFHNVKVDKVLAETRDSDTVGDLWHGPMQIYLRWHKHHVVVGRDLNRPFLPDHLRVWDLGMMHIVEATSAI